MVEDRDGPGQDVLDFWEQMLHRWRMGSRQRDSSLHFLTMETTFQNNKGDDGGEVNKVKKKIGNWF